MNIFGPTPTDNTPGARVSLTTRFNIWFNAIPLFTRSILIICTFIWLIRALFNWPSSYAICFYYPAIKEGDIKRLITHIFFHQDILHILFNMMGLLSLCVFLEHKLGTIYMFCCTVLLSIGTSLVDMFFNFIILDVLKLNDPKGGFFMIDTECGIGYSGVLFSYMIISVSHSPVTRSLFGMYSVSARVYPWVVLLISSVLMPGVSFLGHLSGIVAGYIFVLMIHKNSVFSTLVGVVERFVPLTVTKLRCYYPSDTSSDGYTPLPFDGQTNTDQKGVVPSAILNFTSWIRGKLEDVRGTSTQTEQLDVWANKGQGRVLGHN